jgi:hypothetical protein
MENCFETAHSMFQICLFLGSAEPVDFPVSGRILSSASLVRDPRMSMFFFFNLPNTSSRTMPWGLLSV